MKNMHRYLRIFLDQLLFIIIPIQTAATCSTDHQEDTADLCLMPKHVSSDKADLKEKALHIAEAGKSLEKTEYLTQRTVSDRCALISDREYSNF